MEPSTASETSATESSSASEARKAMVALLAGLAAVLDSAERTMVCAGTPLLEPLTPAAKTPAIRTSKRLFPRSGIALPARSFSGGAPVTVRNRPVRIRNP